MNWKQPLILAVLGLTSVQAHAKTKTEALVAEIDAYANIEANLGMQTDLQTVRGKRAREQCDAVVAKVQRELGKDAELVNFRWHDHPKATPAPNHQQRLAASELGWFCDRYRARLDEIELTAMIKDGKQYEWNLQRGFGDDDRKNLRGEGAKALRETAGRCRALADSMKARGMTATTPLKNAKYEPYVFGDAEKACTAIETWNEISQAEWKKKYAELSKPFVKAGIGGDRLEWLVDYAPGIDGWLVAGCKQAKSIAQVKSAPVLLQWFTTSSGAVRIRRLQFSGHKLVKSGETDFISESAARAAGCR